MAKPTIAQQFAVLEDLEELGVLTERRVMAIFRRHGWKIERAGARNWLLKVGLHKEADALLRSKAKSVAAYTRTAAAKSENVDELKKLVDELKARLEKLGG